jgi:hypothetical protein
MKSTAYIQVWEKRNIITKKGEGRILLNENRVFDLSNSRNGKFSPTKEKKMLSDMRKLSKELEATYPNAFLSVTYVSDQP